MGCVEAACEEICLLTGLFRGGVLLVLEEGVGFVQVREIAEGLGSGLVADHAGVRVVLLG
jgi:hypothetical protein